MELAQFDLVKVTTEEEQTTLRGTLGYSTVQADFWLKRHTGYFMLQVIMIKEILNAIKILAYIKETERLYKFFSW